MHFLGMNLVRVGLANMANGNPQVSFEISYLQLIASLGAGVESHGCLASELESRTAQRHSKSST